MNGLSRRLALLGTIGLACAPFVPGAIGQVVINEVFYHAPQDLNDLEWIELYNPTDKPVDLAGWRFTNGVEFQFPAGSTIAAGGFLVLARDASLFAEFYNVPLAGTYKKALNNSGETIELSDSQGRRVDRMRYRDGNPWPSAADGYSSSLERITPSAPGERAENWAASPLPEEEAVSAGTPGAVNASHSAIFPPVLSGLTLLPKHPAADEPILVEVSAADDTGIATVEARYQVVRPGVIGEEIKVPMTKKGGAVYAATLPGQKAGDLVRISIRAVNQKQAERLYPARHDLRPAVTLHVQNPNASAPARIALASMIHTDPRESAAAERARRAGMSGNNSRFGNPERFEAEQRLNQALDLASTWFQWSVEKDPSYEEYKALRPIFAKLQTAKDELIASVLDSDNLQARLQTIDGTLSDFQASLIEEAKKALPEKAAADFERLYRDTTTPRQPGPADLIKRVMNIEDGWLVLNAEYELSEKQFADLRRIMADAARGRTAHVATVEKLMRGEGNFRDLQAKLGEIEEQMTKDALPLMNRRQTRFIQEWRSGQGSPIRPRSGPVARRSPRGRSAFVWVDPKTGQSEVRDFIHITERSAGFKVRFHKDQPLNGMSTANIIFEYNDRSVLAEPLAFELYRRTGNAASLTDFARLTIDGQPAGYHLVFEQINGSFLRRNGLNADGELYKILWYGRGPEGQHERQDNPEKGHAALMKLLADLDSTEGDAQWEVIRNQFNVDQVVNYFAVNMILSHWDGFFNNYFTYHDVKGSGKWEMYPWDQDKTWGMHDFIEGNEVFFDMPITFGMKGDRPPGGGAPTFNPRSWWRPPGYFSGPLLANPHFRKRFLARTRAILEQVYTREGFFPVIDDLAAKLRPEIPVRAGIVGEPPDVALARFEGNIASLKEHLLKRREFLLNTPELKAVSN